MGIGFQLLERASELIRHTVGILLLAWRRMLRAMLVGALVGIVLAEIAAAALTRQVPPGIPAHVAALVFGVAIAYAAGLTVLVGELLRGAIETVRLLEGDAEAGARAAAIVAERGVGEIRLGLAPRRAASGAAAIAASSLFASGAGDAPDGQETSAETLDAIAATDEFTSTAPRPRVNARPVRADQLPRIPWAYEQHPVDSTATQIPAATEDAHAAETVDTIPAIAVPDVDPLPPLPLKSMPEPEPPADTAEAVTPAGPPASPAPFIVTPAPRTIPPQTAASETRSAEASSLEAHIVPVVSQPRAALGTQSADPAESPSRDAEPRGVWSRISQALVGNTLVEPTEWSDSASGDGMPAGDTPPAPPPSGDGSAE